MLKPLLAITLTLLAGCAASRGFDHGALSSALAPEARVTEDDIHRVLALRPQLPRPFKLGVFFRSGARPPQAPYLYHHAGWHWQPGDKQKVLDLGQSLQQGGLVSDTVLVSPETSAGEDLKAIRLAAARHGVDAVLIVNGIADVDRYNNALGVTYALLVTPLFVPGTVVDALFVSHAALWDVRNEYLYVSAEADGTASQTRPPSMIDEEGAVSLARERSMTALVASVQEHMRSAGAAGSK